MSPKTLLRIALALGVLLLAWAGLAWFRAAGRDRPPSVSLPRITEAEADRIVMARPGDTVVVSKVAEGRWETTGAPASPEAVRDFFEALGDSSARSELVAQSAASHARMGVDSATAKRLTISAGDSALLQLWLGNRGPDFEGYYVRRPPAAEVYLYHGQFAGLADQRVEDWRDRVIAKIPPESISVVEVWRGKRRWSVKRAGSAWTSATGGAVDSGAVARYIQQLAEIRASGFPDRAQADSARFEPADRRLAVSGGGGSPLTVLVFDSTYGGFWVRAASGGPLYKLDSQRAEALTPEERTILPN